MNVRFACGFVAAISLLAVAPCLAQESPAGTPDAALHPMDNPLDLLTKEQKAFVMPALENKGIRFVHWDGRRLDPRQDSETTPLTQITGECNVHIIHAVRDGQVKDTEHALFWKQRCLQQRINDQSLRVTVEGPAPGG